MDFVGPVEESGVAFFVGSVGVGGEVVDVFEEASRERSLLARFLGFHELLDDAVVPGWVAAGEVVPKAERFFAGGFFPVDEGDKIDAVEERLIFDCALGEREKGGVDVR